MCNRRRHIADHRGRGTIRMNKTILLAAIAFALAAPQAFAASAACEKQADEKKLSGAARTSFITKCEKDAGGGSPHAGCVKQADEKKLAGAARTSFVVKCEKDAGGADIMGACEKSAADKKLAGAAKASHIKKCLSDAGAAKS
jgi:hypothetical protein